VRESRKSVEARSKQQRQSWRGWNDHRRRQGLAGYAASSPRAVGPDVFRAQLRLSTGALRPWSVELDGRQDVSTRAHVPSPSLGAVPVVFGPGWGQHPPPGRRNGEQLVEYAVPMRPNEHGFLVSRIYCARRLIFVTPKQSRSMDSPPIDRLRELARAGRSRVWRRHIDPAVARRQKGRSTILRL
jgi:hypothetical protein